MATITVVVPTIREQSINSFLTAWEKEFSGLEIIVVEDNPQKSFKLPQWIQHYSWEDIESELGKNSWIIPRRSAAVRSYGFIKAWQKGSTYILTLDDDCLPEKNYKNGFMKDILTSLKKEWESDYWWNTLENQIYPRGYPYELRNKKQPTMVHHGLWSNIPDLDGITQKKYPELRTKPFKKVEKVPHGKYFPMCSMNLAFRREILPAMYFLLMGKDKNENKWPYDRFDDIWAGIFIKKICDHLGYAITSGAPSVKHSRASNTDVNIEKEKTGIPVNEWLWREVEDIRLTSNTIEGCYLEIAKELGKKGGYWNKLSTAMEIWISLLD
jgi:hypothetical protein